MTEQEKVVLPKEYVINRDALVLTFSMALRLLPQRAERFDPNRMTLLHFCVGGLDLLSALDDKIVVQKRKDIIEWVYRQQVLLHQSSESESESIIEVGKQPTDHVIEVKERGKEALRPHYGGFRCGPSVPQNCSFDEGHVAMTYSALFVLKTCGDDFSRVDVDAMRVFLRECQNEDGSFSATPMGGETDVRFLYCAAAICEFLGTWDCIDCDGMWSYLLKCQARDGAFGQTPGKEPHGGSTYCAVSAAKLLKKDDKIPRFGDLVHWLVQRHAGGFQGRPEKDPDTCYTYWIGCSLMNLIGTLHYVDVVEVAKFIKSCEGDPPLGGIAKTPDNEVDLMHTYLGLAGLSLIAEQNIDVGIKLKQIHPSLGIAKSALQ